MLDKKLNCNMGNFPNVLHAEGIHNLSSICGISPRDSGD